MYNYDDNYQYALNSNYPNNYCRCYCCNNCGCFWYCCNRFGCHWYYCDRHGCRCC